MNSRSAFALSDRNRKRDASIGSETLIPKPNLNFSNLKRTDDLIFETFINENKKNNHIKIKCQRQGTFQDKDQTLLNSTQQNEEQSPIVSLFNPTKSSLNKMQSSLNKTNTSHFQKTAKFKDENKKMSVDSLKQSEPTDK